MMMQADKSQDLYLASWRSRRADGVVPVWVRAPASWESQRCHSSPKTSRLNTKKEPTFQSEGKKKQCPSLKAGRRILSDLGKVSLFVIFRSSTDRMGLTHIMHRSLLLCSPNVRLGQERSHRSPRVMSHRLSGQPAAQSSQHIKYNHYTLISAKVLYMLLSEY